MIQLAIQHRHHNVAAVSSKLMHLHMQVSHKHKMGLYEIVSK